MAILASRTILCVVELLLPTYGTSSSSHVPTIPNESNQHRTVDKKGDEQYCIRFLFYQYSEKRY